MASSVAKLKPLSSVIAEPDEVLVQNMEENEVLAGLARNSDSTRKADILDELRANARRNGGRLQFDDRLGLFRVLQEALADPNSNTRLRCIEFLCEIIPEFGGDLDNCMTLVLPLLVSNIGHNQVSLKKSAIQTLHVYMKHSSQVSVVLNAIIDHGLESEDRRTRTESLVALPILIMPNLAHEDLFTLTKALVGRLENSSRPETSPAVISLERIKNVVGSTVFDSYLHRLSPDQRNLCVSALQNRSADPLKDLELLGGRKAKSAGHLNTNGIIADAELPGNDTLLDRGHTIAVTNTDGYPDANYGPLEFGFVPLPVMLKLRDQSNWRIRAQGIEELKTLMGQLTDTEPIHPNLGPLFALLLDFLDDVNFKIGVTSLQIIGLLVAKLGVGVRPVLKPLLLALSNKLGDNKIVIRQENMKVFMQLMQILSPKAVLSVLTSSLQHRNSRVREETVNVFIAALLTFPSSDFNLPDLTNAIAPALVDSKRRVRQAALEAFAVIAQAMGPGRIQPVVSAVDAIELTTGGDGVMAAITARLARRQLPRLNRDGLIEYAVPMPSSGTIRGQNNTPRGADIDWILAGTAATVSADTSGSARSTPGLNDSLNMSGPSPRRFFSAGKNRLPWEGDQGRNGDQLTSDNVEPLRPPMKLNSWAPTEIVNDRAAKSTPQSRTTSLTTPPKSKLTTSSYAEKYHAMSMQRASQVADRHVPKAAENTPGSSYAEMHRAKVKKDKSKIGNPGVGLNQTAPAGTAVNSYALLYKRGTIATKAKASNSAEPASGEQAPKEVVPRGAQSVTPTPPFSLQSSFSPGEEESFLTSQRKAFSMSLSSSWPDWTELKREMKPFGRLSPVSHSIPTEMDTSAEQGDAELKKRDAPQTPIHMKPQLARSASKARGLRATELVETRKPEVQSGVMDFLEMTPTRPTQLAPVKAGSLPPQDALNQVHKQAELKRALKMYSVISDGEDGRSRSPSPLENNNDLPNTPLFENTTRLSKLPTKPESPFDSKPRIARTPIHSRRLSAETSLQLQSPTPLPNTLSDLEDAGLGVTGHGLLSTKGGRTVENSPLENGVHSYDGKHSRTSGVGTSISGNDDTLGMGKVEVVGQGLLRLDKQLKAEEGVSQLQYETEESDEEVEDDDGQDEEDEEDEQEEEGEEEEEEEEGEEEGEEEEGEIQDAEEEEESGTDSEEEGYPTPSESQEADISTETTTTLTSTTTSTFRSEESSDSLEDSDEDSDSGIRDKSDNMRDMTPKTMRKSLSKSTRERMERRRQEEEERLQREEERFTELERERTKQVQIQQEEEERLRQKILKEQSELGKMLNRKEKERELERQKQQQLQEELQRQEKALRDRLLKQQEELEEIEQEKQRERERQKERMKERMRQKQKQKEAELLRAETELKEKEREQEEELRRKLAEKEAELKKKQLLRAKEMKNAAESQSNDLSVKGSSSPLKSNRKPPTGGSPKKKEPVSSAQSERDSSYAVTDDPSQIRRHHAASAGSTSTQCWEVSVEDLQPFNNPDNALREALKYLANTEDWEMKCEGIQGVRRLSKHHPEVLVSQLHTVTLAIIAEVKNLRSQVSRSGICCLGDMYTTLGKNMDNELEVTAKILLAKAGESSGFIRDDVEKALTAMVSSLTPTRVLVALISGGASHRNVSVRKTTAQFLSLLADRMGASRLMSGAKDVTEKILPTTAQFLTDGGQETRYYGRKILYSIYDHPEFDKNVSKHVPSNLQKSMRDTAENLRTKGLGDPPSDLSSSARQRKPASGGGGSRSGGVRGSVVLSPSSSSSSREPSRSGKPVTRDGLVQGEEMIPNLVNSLQASDWKERQQAVNQFVDLVQLNPDGLGQKFTKVFDAFIPRLQDSNSKVNLYALQCLPKILPCLVNQSGALVPPVVAALTSNFASKNTNIFSAAEEALDELIKYIDNTLLVQPFCSTTQYGSSRVKPIMVDKLADIVPTVHARKPQVISRYVLPLLWNLLSAASNSSAGVGNSVLKTSTSRLTNTLYSCMGRSLTEQASSQVPRIQEKLHEIIGS